jgi:hypothetical protein
MDKSKIIYDDLMRGEIHKSVMQDYVRCKALLRFLGIRVNNPSEQIYAPSEWGAYLMNKGNFFHEFANYFGITTNEVEFIAKLETLHKRKLLVPAEASEIKDTFLEYVIPDDQMKDEDSPFVHYYYMIDAYLGFEANRLIGLRKEKFNNLLDLWKPVAVEIKFDVKKIIDLPDKIVDEFGFKDMLFKVKGTIDRINRFDLKNEKLEMMEYKTGGWSNQSSSKMTNVRRELAFYTLFNSPYPVGNDRWDITDMSCYNPEVPPAIGYMTSPIKTQTTNAMIKQLVKLQLAIEEDDFDHPVCSPYVCSFCQYLDACSEYYKDQWDATNGNLQETKDKRLIERKKNVTPY